MPLVKLFSRRRLNVSAKELHRALVPIWGVDKTPQVLKVLCIPVADGSSSGEDVYVSVRAKAKPERTPEVAQECCRRTAQLLAHHGHSTVLRLELYESSLQYSFSQEASRTFYDSDDSALSSRPVVHAAREALSSRPRPGKLGYRPSLDQPALYDYLLDQPAQPE